MAPAGGGDETGESRGSPVRRGVDRIPSGGVAAGQDLGASRKRKAAVLSEDSSSLVGNGEHLEVTHDDSQKLLKEIEDLKAQIDKDVKELGYCEANEKLRVELVLKVEQMQCLRKQNEEVRGKSDGMRKWNEELQVKNDGLAKQNKELQAKNDDLVKENEEMRTNIDSMRKRNVKLQDENGGLTKGNEKLQAKNVGLAKQNKELHAKNDAMAKQNKDLQAKNDDLVEKNDDLVEKNEKLRVELVLKVKEMQCLKKQIKEVRGKNDGMRKQIKEMQCLRKRNKELQVKNDGPTKQNNELQVFTDALVKNNEELRTMLDNMTKRNVEMEAEEVRRSAISQQQKWEDLMYRFKSA